MKRILSDPLFAFLIISFLIFGYFAMVNDNSDLRDSSIVMTDSDIERLIDIYQRTWNNPPDSIALKRLIDQELKNEIFYKEGLKMNLDHNDEIIRRRLVQKYEFLMKDIISDSVQPEESQLKEYYQLNQERYQTETSYSMEQYYFSPDKPGDPKLRAKRFYELVSTNNIDPRDQSDPLHLPTQQIDKTANQLMQTFGAAFVESLVEVTDIGWQRPILSGYGWHVINLINSQAPETLSYESVTEQVAQDYRNDQLTIYNDKFYEALRQDYDVQWKLNKWEAWAP